MASPEQWGVGSEQNQWEGGVKGVVLGIDLGLGAVLRIDLGLGLVLETDSEKNIAHFSKPVASSSFPTPYCSGRSQIMSIENRVRYESNI